MDEVSAAAHRLYLEEQYEQKEYREELLQRLRQFEIKNLTKQEKDRLKKIIEASQLTDNLNHRLKVGNTLDQVKSDAEFFEKISKTAKGLLEILDK